MSCTTPQIPSSHANEAAQFAKQFGEQASNFIKALNLPSAFDSSVLSYKSRTAPYYVQQLEDPDIVRPFIQDSVESAIQGLTVNVDASAIINGIFNSVNAFVVGAKTVPTFGGFSSTSYRGAFFGTDAIFKVFLAVYAADATQLYESKPESVLQLAYHACLTVQKAD